MTPFQKQIVSILMQDYIREKANNHVWGREPSQGYTLALGKLQGVCMVLDLELRETDKSVMLLTSNGRIIDKADI